MTERIDGNQDQEPVNRERVVQPGETFQFFTTSATIKAIESPRGPIFISEYGYGSKKFSHTSISDRITLAIDNLRIPFQTNAMDDFILPQVANTLTPFHPQSGYQITSEDFKPETRQKKAEDHIEALERTVSDPYYIRLIMGNMVDLAQESGVNFEKLRKKLEKFRLVLTGGDMRVVSERLGTSSSGYYSDFFPADFGPLPKVEVQGEYNKMKLKPGFSICVPQDMLGEIEGRFVVS